jgi:hypothetical protein
MHYRALWLLSGLILTGCPSSTAGERGTEGPQGEPGETGAQGPAGPAGEKGATGDRGLQGPEGLQGAQGGVGSTGPVGPAGMQGAQGPLGPQGVAGPQGLQGPIGATGSQGQLGPTGPQGDTGLLTPGGSIGATPYWNGTSWVVDSTNFYNAGGGLGVGTSSPIAALTVKDSALAGCSFCRRWADANGRAAAAWNCTGLDVANQLDFVGDVDATDDLDFAMVCPSTPANNFQLCRRAADNNGRLQTAWSCVDSTTSTPTTGIGCGVAGILCTDFTGDVNDDDDFDVLIKTRVPGQALLTSCGIGVRWADNNGRGAAPWRYAAIGHALRTDFVGNVDASDDLDFMLTCSIPFEDP